MRVWNRDFFSIKTFAHCGCQFNKPSGDCEEFLGVDENIAYYFHEGVLDREFLSKIKTRADSYIIYAETCAVAEEFLQRYKIEFRKIPRDILKI